MNGEEQRVKIVTKKEIKLQKMDIVEMVLFLK